MPALSQQPIDRIALHAQSHPEAVACIDLASGERLSYRDFDVRVSTCASVLSQRLRAPGQRVAVLSRNSADLAVLSAATERCGAVFVPLNWRLTPSEHAYQLGDAAPTPCSSSRSIGITSSASGASSSISAMSPIKHGRAGPGWESNGEDLGPEPDPGGLANR
ncbi:MAG: AMP-binding protein [Rhodospirillales bacterium]|nr:AMP-binding protein [Rhodospirillales bacterium]